MCIQPTLPSQPQSSGLWKLHSRSGDSIVMHKLRGKWANFYVYIFPLKKDEMAWDSVYWSTFFWSSTVISQPSRGIGWQRGIMSDVFFAAMTPAIMAVVTIGPFADLRACKALDEVSFPVVSLWNLLITMNVWNELLSILHGSRNEESFWTWKDPPVCGNSTWQRAWATLFVGTWNIHIPYKDEY